MSQAARRFSQPPTPNPHLSLEVMRRLPKAELHRHLDGSVRPNTIIELAREQKVDLPTFNEKELRGLICVDEHCTSLEEYLRGFHITNLVLQKAYALTRVMFECCEDAANDGVKYLEVRFSPILHVSDELTISTVMEATIEGVHMAEVMLPITVRIIVCGMRHMKPEITEMLAEIAWRYRNSRVVGFDLAGPEDGFSSKIHKSAFDIVRSKCLNCTLHSGEAAGWESIQDSIRHCGALRLGHGVRLNESPSLLQFVIDRRIAVESCPTSNVHTKAVTDLAEHPIRDYYDQGVVVVPCTDNTTVSNVTLSEEYIVLQRHFGFTIEDFARVIDNGFGAGFVDNSLKRRLRADAMRQVLDVVAKEGYDISGIVHMYEVDPQFADLTVERTPVYWEGWTNPPISLEICRGIPKADLHCRLDGSVTFDTMWKLYQGMTDGDMGKLNLQGPRMEDFAQFRHIFETKQAEARGVTKKLMNGLLQTREQIVTSVLDVFRSAVEDGVAYMEMMVRPKSHTKLGLTQTEVIEAILEGRSQAENTMPIKSGIVVFVNGERDDPVEFYATAQLVTKYQEQGIVGFGVFGHDLTGSSFQYFRSTFNYLKASECRVCIGAGKTDYHTIVNALHEGGASRISGAFEVHRDPILVNYLANMNMPVELGMTELMEEYTSDISKLTGNPIRLLVDNNLAVVMCSFKLARNRLTRSEMILKMAQECNFNIAELLKVMGYGFLHNFSSRSRREEMWREFWTEAVKFVKTRGFKHLKKKVYFPSLHNESKAR